VLNPETVAQQMRLLANYLGATDVEEEELESLESLQVEGSCKWFLQTTSFRDWRDTESAEHQTPGDLSSRLQKLATNGGRLSTQRAPPRIFWLTGAPGCGKSVIVSAVVRHLQEEDRQCYFYFLKHTDKSKQNLSGLLISLAWQMARRDVALRRSLLRMRLEDELTAESNDFRAIWKQLFTQRILRTHFQQRQYWIIDALDEAHGGHELISLLKGVPENLPISIFVTSRKDLTLEKHMQRAPMLQVVTKRIEPRDTLADIRLYLEDNVEDLPVSDPADVEDLIEKLTLKSQGSFLWTRLMLQKLENTWAQGDIDEAIDSIPEGLQDMYLQILEDMEENNASNKELAKSILRWAVCGGRPLTKVELQEAIRLDTGQKVHKLGKMLERLCGQLVSIDDQDRLQMVHDTARDFLLDPTLNSEFAINKAETHEQLADICLKYLLEDTKTPATRRPFPTINDSTVPAFRSYASLYFSEHVFKSPPADPQTARSRLEVFLEHSILNWIEYIITETKDLSRLTQAAKNLKGYVERRLDFQSPLSPEMKTVDDWAVDLIRLVTVFGCDLLSQPSAIHDIIPPLCPPNSILHRKFGNSTLGMEVVGLSARGWTDRIHSTSFAPTEATAVSCCEKRYAVGLHSGSVILYYASTCQEARRFSHGEQVRHLTFAHGSAWIVAAGNTLLTMWNYKTAQKIWETRFIAGPVALTITEDDSTIFVASRNNEVISFDAKDGTEIGHTPWHGEDRPPQKAYISSELKLVALVHRNKPVALFDLYSLERPKFFAVEASVSALAFNAALNMLAVGSSGGELCTVGIWNLREEKRTEVDASHLAVSTDGQTLLVGTNVGSIQVRDFLTLDIIYTINFDDEEIVSMVFASNSLRFLDIRRHEFNIWEPSALFRRKDSDDSTSEGQTSFSTAPSQLVQTYMQTEQSPITAIVNHPKGGFVFCGNDNGIVAVYDTARGKLVKELFKNKASITCLDWNAEKEILVSSDSSSRILVHRLRQVQNRSSAGTHPVWQSQQVLERTLEESIRQILLSNDGEYLLISTATSDQLWTLGGESLISHNHEQGHALRPSQRWMTHPLYKRRLFEVDKTAVHFIQWEKHSVDPPVMKKIDVDPNQHVDHESRDVSIHIVKFGEDNWAAFDNNPASRPVMWTGPPSSRASEAAIASALAYFGQIVPIIKSILGMYRSQLVFLNTEGWVCSMRLDGGLEKRMIRHFPVPYYWLTISQSIVSTITSGGDVIIARSDELAIVKRGLSF
jgi:WD40 repeat protein